MNVFAQCYSRNIYVDVVMMAGSAVIISPWQSWACSINLTFLSNIIEFTKDFSSFIQALEL